MTTVIPGPDNPRLPGGPSKYQAVFLATDYTGETVHVYCCLNAADGHVALSAPIPDIGSGSGQSGLMTDQQQQERRELGQKLTVDTPVHRHRAGLVEPLLAPPPVLPERLHVE